MKKVLMAVLALVVILLALVLAHPLWIGPVVRTAVGQLAPKFLGVPAKLDGFSLNAYTGRVTIDGFALDNPPGCSELKFVTVGHLCVDVDPLSVLSDPVVVEELTLKDLYVSLVTDGNRVYNYETISRTCSPETEKPVAKPAEEKPREKKPGPKVIVDLIQVENALVQWEKIPLPLPSFRLTGLGRGMNGLECDAAWKEVQTRFVASLGPLASGLQAGLEGVNGKFGEGVKVFEKVSKSLGTSTKALTGDAANVLKDGTKVSTDAAKTSVDAAKTSVDATAKTIEEGVNKFKSLFK